MPTIPMTNSEIEIIVDEEDYDFLLSYGPFFITADGYPAPTRSAYGTGYSFVHHIIADRMCLVGYEEIDHDNRIRHDARRINIKASTKSDNRVNRGMSKTHTSGFKFVTWSTHTQKWRVGIKRKKFNIFLGYFTDLERAVRARDTYLKAHPEIKVGDLSD